MYSAVSNFQLLSANRGPEIIELPLKLLLPPLIYIGFEVAPQGDEDGLDSF